MGGLGVGEDGVAGRLLLMRHVVVSAWLRCKHVDDANRIPTHTQNSRRKQSDR